MFCLNTYTDVILKELETCESQEELQAKFTELQRDLKRTYCILRSYYMLGLDGEQTEKKGVLDATNE